MAFVIKIKERTMRVFVLILLSLLAACQSQPVAIWERQHLSERTMTQPISKLSSELKTHIYFSKEGSSGGSFASAGGCGCN